MGTFDVLVIGAGGAGMMCAFQAAQRGRRTALFDHSPKPGAKILISGGGRCNFTNRGAGPDNYVSQNPHFCRSALARFTPEDFIALVEKHRIPYHEKKLGQLFCDHSAQAIVDLLTGECGRAGVAFHMGKPLTEVRKIGEGFTVRTGAGDFQGKSLVVATGGLSIPKVGATDLGYRLARQFGLKVVPTSPALDGFRFSPGDLKKFGDLTGVALDSRVTAGGVCFRENILFTHAGLSGPAALQASLYWKAGEAIQVDLLPGVDGADWEAARPGPKQNPAKALGRFLPHRLAERLVELEWPGHPGEKDWALWGEKLRDYALSPAATVGYSKAEVTRGGVDTDELSSKTMESRKVPGLYFIGEVVDVTGWLGGYNFQWAWSSGWAAGQAV
ncbi:MAG TPA: NAD(P)/FAD-dependent oxidoreductase [bacterium]|nr:NAD(P)/FAD-dependent oxidoreductase [bacterium]